jgi:RES domain-containing protein
MARHRVLDEPLACHRIGDPDGEFPIFSGEGARRFPGRWNVAGQSMIYASANYSTSLLEKLVRTSIMPPNQHYLTITVPAGVSYEEFNEAKVPGWDADNSVRAKAFGSDWYASARSAILVVPSVIARLDRNILINSDHPEFRRIKASREVPIWWDDRLFK